MQSNIIYIKPKMNDTNLSNSSTDARDDLSKYYKCRSCGMQFDNLGDMQRHILVEHMQKGDVISEEKEEK
jgi:hypothetical protein